MHKGQEDTHILQLLQFQFELGSKEEETATINIHRVITRVHNGVFGRRGRVLKQVRHLYWRVSAREHLLESRGVYQVVLVRNRRRK